MLNQFTASLWGDEAFSAILSMKSLGGIISTIAGGLDFGYGGDNGPSTQAVLTDPEGMGSPSIAMAAWICSS